MWHVSVGEAEGDGERLPVALACGGTQTLRYRHRRRSFHRFPPNALRCAQDSRMENVESTLELVQAWLDAATDLGIDVVAPFTLGVDSKELQCVGLIP
jgi:hypothetical protein